MESGTFISPLEQTRDHLRAIIGGETTLLDSPVEISSRPHDCFSLAPGEVDVVEEWLVEAALSSSRGESVCSFPCSFRGNVGDVIALPLDDGRNRALFVACVNALAREVKLVEHTLHCGDEERAQCGADLAKTLLRRFGWIRVGMIGLNPLLSERLVETFGAERVRIAAAVSSQAGRMHAGVDVWDRSRTAELIHRSDLVLFTGATLVNGTFDSIWRQIQEEGKDYVAYGNTFTGIGRLMGVEGICPFAR